MKSHRNTARGRSRDLGLDTGAGKGDADRVSDVQAYRANYSQINWGRKPEIFAETEGEWGPDVIGSGLGTHAPTTDIHRE